MLIIYQLSHWSYYSQLEFLGDGKHAATVDEIGEYIYIS